jgi:hypothetical protein
VATDGHISKENLLLADVLSFASPKESTKEKATSNGIAPRVRSGYTLVSFGSIGLNGAVFDRWGASIRLCARAQEIPALRWRFGRDDATIGLYQVIPRAKKAPSWARRQLFNWAFEVFGQNHGICFYDRRGGA